MCVDCVIASPRIAQVDPGNGPLPKVLLSHWKPLDHVPASPNDSKKINFQMKSLKFKLLSLLILMPLPIILDYFTKLILTFIPKHQFILLTFSTNMQITKKSTSVSICFKGPTRAK
jgi:hypothetical protein